MESKNETRVFLVDDHQLMREGLKTVLAAEPGIMIAGEAGSYEEMIKRLPKRGVDVLILDISLPDRNGLEILKDLRERHPNMKTLILSMHPEERFGVRALKAGAWGYVNKQTAATELVSALERIRNGKKFVSPELAEQLLDEIDQPRPQAPHELLTDREFEILQLIATGKSAAQIGQQLSLSVNTITTYRTRILHKMNLRNNADLIRYSLEHRLID